MKSNLLKQALIPLGLMVVAFIAILLLMNMTNGLKSAPKLEIYGGNKFSTTDEKFLIKGKTDPRATLTVAGKKTNIDKDGTFSYEVPLKDGEQKYEVVAKKNLAKSQQEVSVTRIVELQTTQSSPTPKANSGSGIVSDKNNDSGLANSGPKENLFGVFGITAIMYSLLFYKKSKKKQNTGYKAFTIS